MVILPIVVGIIVFILLGEFLYLFKVWSRALASGARISITDLIGMKLRRIPLQVIVNAKIMAVKAGLEVSTNDLEAHHIAGGNVNKVVEALIAADKANIELSFKQAAAYDLGGSNEG
jgi:uncharacterized protein YqfA (UPF0365 family)